MAGAEGRPWAAAGLLVAAGALRSALQLLRQVRGLCAASISFFRHSSTSCRARRRGAGRGQETSGLCLLLRPRPLKVPEAATASSRLQSCRAAFLSLSHSLTTSPLAPCPAPTDWPPLAQAGLPDAGFALIAACREERVPLEQHNLETGVLQNLFPAAAPGAAPGGGGGPAGAMRRPSSGAPPIMHCFALLVLFPAGSSGREQGSRAGRPSLGMSAST